MGLNGSGVETLNGYELNEYTKLKVIALSHGRLERISGN